MSILDDIDYVKLEDLVLRSRTYIGDSSEQLSYVYIVGFLGLGKYYLGVRTARGCHPREFGIKYRTSSKEVKRLWNTYGKPELILILRTFRERELAIEYETYCLRYLGVLGNRNWLNENISRCISSEKCSEGTRKRNELYGNPRKSTELQRRLGFMGNWKRWKILKPMRQKLLTYEEST